MPDTYDVLPHRQFVSPSVHLPLSSLAPCRPPTQPYCVPRAPPVGPIGLPFSTRPHGQARTLCGLPLALRALPHVHLHSALPTLPSLASGSHNNPQPQRLHPTHPRFPVSARCEQNSRDDHAGALPGPLRCATPTGPVRFRHIGTEIALAPSSSGRPLLPLPGPHRPLHLITIITQWWW